jgi:hypothetical protein
MFSPISCTFLGLVKRTLALLLSLWLLVFAGPTWAEWQEIDKDEDVTHLWDKEAVKAVHVSRYVWTLSDYAKAAKTYKGDTFQSEMVRWRLYCKNDTFVRLSASYFDKPLGKGREVMSIDEQEWKTKEYPIRPNTYLAALKKQVCQAES